MSKRSLIAVSLMAVGSVALIVGAVKLLSDDPDSGLSRARGSLSADIASAEPATDPFPELTALRVTVGDRCLRLVVADTLDERIAGLRSRRDLGNYDGMLFVFDEATDVGFTMSTVPVPLEIGFYDDAGLLVSTQHMQPCAKVEDACPVYRSDEPFTYAVETLKEKLPGGGISMCPS